jgi:ribose-phosphate pyrophosphokinase
MSLRLIAGRSNLELAQLIAKELDIILMTCDICEFANTEISVELCSSVRGKDVYILQTGSRFEDRSINDHLMELYLLIDGCFRSQARSINVITPCFPYARSDKKDDRGPISAKLAINQIFSAGAARLIAMDLHSGQEQGFTDKPFDNIYGIGIISESINKIISGNKSSYILVSPDAGALKTITKYAKKLGLNYVTLHKQRNYSLCNVVESSILLGNSEILMDLHGKTAIIIDDMIDTCGTMIAGVQTLVENGIKDVILVATHGFFSKEAIHKLNLCKEISQVIVTNTICQKYNIEMCPKIRVIDVSLLLSNVIRCIRDDNSISALFE